MPNLFLHQGQQERRPATTYTSSESPGATAGWPGGGQAARVVAWKTALPVELTSSAMELGGVGDPFSNVGLFELASTPAERCPGSACRLVSRALTRGRRRMHAPASSGSTSTSPHHAAWRRNCVNLLLDASGQRVHTCPWLRACFDTHLLLDHGLRAGPWASVQGSAQHWTCLSRPRPSRSRAACCGRGAGGGRNQSIRTARVGLLAPPYGARPCSSPMLSALQPLPRWESLFFSSPSPMTACSAVASMQARFGAQKVAGGTGRLPPSGCSMARRCGQHVARRLCST